MLIIYKDEKNEVIEFRGTPEEIVSQANSIGKRYWILASATEKLHPLCAIRTLEGLNRKPLEADVMQLWRAEKELAHRTVSGDGGDAEICKIQYPICHEQGEFHYVNILMCGSHRLALAITPDGDLPSELLAAIKEDPCFGHPSTKLIFFAVIRQTLSSWITSASLIIDEADRSSSDEEDERLLQRLEEFLGKIEALSHLLDKAPSLRRFFNTNAAEWTQLCSSIRTKITLLRARERGIPEKIQERADKKLAAEDREREIENFELDQEVRSLTVLAGALALTALQQAVIRIPVWSAIPYSDSDALASLFSLLGTFLLLLTNYHICLAAYYPLHKYTTEKLRKRRQPSRPIKRPLSQSIKENKPEER